MAGYKLNLHIDGKNYCLGKWETIEAKTSAQQRFLELLKHLPSIDSPEKKEADLLRVCRTFTSEAHFSKEKQKERAAKSEDGRSYIGVLRVQHSLRLWSAVSTKKILGKVVRYSLGSYLTQREAGEAYDRFILYSKPQNIEVLNFPSANLQPTSAEDLRTESRLKLKGTRYIGIYKCTIPRLKNRDFWTVSIPKTIMSRTNLKYDDEIFIGNYLGERTAAEVYDRAVLYYYGPEAPLNFPKNRKHYMPASKEILRGERRVLNRPVEKTKFFGTHFDPGKNAWFAQVDRNGKHTVLGPFACDALAAKSLDAHAMETEGIEARFNFHPMTGQALFGRKLTSDEKYAIGRNLSAVKKVDQNEIPKGRIKEKEVDGCGKTFALDVQIEIGVNLLIGIYTSQEKALADQMEFWNLFVLKKSQLTQSDLSKRIHYYNQKMNEANVKLKGTGTDTEYFHVKRRKEEFFVSIEILNKGRKELLNKEGYISAEQAAIAADRLVRSLYPDRPVVLNFPNAVSNAVEDRDAIGDVKTETFYLSRFRDVYVNKKNKRSGEFKDSWQVKIDLPKGNSKTERRAIFCQCEIEAAEFSDRIRLFYFGPNAFLNFPEKANVYLPSSVETIRQEIYQRRRGRMKSPTRFIGVYLAPNGDWFMACSKGDNGRLGCYTLRNLSTDVAAAKAYDQVVLSIRDRNPQLNFHPFTGEPMLGKRLTEEEWEAYKKLRSQKALEIEKIVGLKTYKTAS